MSRALEQAIKQIKDKGFSHIKFEYEADLERENSDSDCGNCDSGVVECNDCGGSGYNIDDQDQTFECSSCSGEGNYDCEYCGGRGVSGNDWGIEECEAWILNRLSKPTRQSLDYINFYNDGSVDSELTFTLPIEKSEMALEIMQAWNDLAMAIGNGQDINNSGMHITLLTGSDYPSNKLLDTEKITNFRTQVTKLLPALYFTASHQGFTRKLDFRLPRVSDDDKYSAIYTHGDTCLEFRIFDTCYNQPEALFDKIEVMAQTLKFYSYEKIHVKFKEFRFAHADKFTDYYNSPELLDALNETLKYAKPASKTITQVKKERKFNLSKKTLLKEAQRIKKVRLEEYKGYLDGFSMRLANDVRRYTEDIKYYNSREEGRNIITRDFHLTQAGVNRLLTNPEALFKHLVEIKRISPTPPTFEQWNNGKESSRRNAYTLQIA